MPFRPPLQFAQVRPAPGLRHPRPRSRHNPLKNGRHKESLIIRDSRDYESRLGIKGAPPFSRLLREGGDFDLPFTPSPAKPSPTSHTPAPSPTPPPRPPSAASAPASPPARQSRPSPRRSPSANTQSAHTRHTSAPHSARPD